MGIWSNTIGLGFTRAGTYVFYPLPPRFSVWEVEDLTEDIWIKFITHYAVLYYSLCPWYMCQDIFIVCLVLNAQESKWSPFCMPLVMCLPLVMIRLNHILSQYLRGKFRETRVKAKSPSIFNYAIKMLLHYKIYVKYNFNVFKKEKI